MPVYHFLTSEVQLRVASAVRTAQESPNRNEPIGNVIDALESLTSNDVSGELWLQIADGAAEICNSAVLSARFAAFLSRTTKTSISAAALELEPWLKALACMSEKLRKNPDMHPFDVVPTSVGPVVKPQLLITSVSDLRSAISSSTPSVRLQAALRLNSQLPLVAECAEELRSQLQRETEPVIRDFFKSALARSK